MPYLRVRPVIPAAGALAVAALLVPAPSRAAHHAPQDPVKTALGDAQIQGTITAAQATSYNDIYTNAVAASNRISGNNRTQLKAAIKIIRGIAHRDSLTPPRMPFVFLVLKRNAEWWTAHRQPTAGSQGEPGAKGRTCTAPTRRSARAHAARSANPTAHSARISFAGSGIVFEYYPGMGLQLQVNGTFGNANALLHTDNPRKHHLALEILDEMRPLIAPRGGAPTWEYEFPFGGGTPPWASGLSQATAIEAYTTAATTHDRPKDLQLALQLSALFSRSAPVGVRVPLGQDGNWYALYSFAPGQQVLNADLDAVVALYDLQKASHDPSVAALESAGLRALTRRIKSFDTGTWSRYSAHGPLADLNYHVLNRDEAKALCQRTNVVSICNAWHSFTHELEVRCPKPTKPKPKPTPTTPTTPSTPTPSVPQQPGPGGGVSAPTTTTTPTTPTTTTTPAQTVPTTPGGGGGGVGAPGG
jgi:D-glucuronyl C5-epimerase C-terminus